MTVAEGEPSPEISSTSAEPSGGRPPLEERRKPEDQAATLPLSVDCINQTRLAHMPRNSVFTSSESPPKRVCRGPPLPSGSIATTRMGSRCCCKIDRARVGHVGSLMRTNKRSFARRSRTS